MENAITFQNIFYFLISLSILNLIFSFIWKWVIVVLSPLPTIIDEKFNTDLFKYYILLFKSIGIYFYVSLTIILVIELSYEKNSFLSFFNYAIGYFIIFLALSVNAVNSLDHAISNADCEMLEMCKYDRFLAIASIPLYIIVAFIPEFAINLVTINLIGLIYWLLNIDIINWIIIIISFFTLLNILYHGLISSRVFFNLIIDSFRNS